MRIALCNEVLRGLAIDRQFAFATAVGYDGLEIAPFTLAEAPGEISAAQRAEVRRAAAAAGIAVSGLHWLLVSPDGLSITTPERPLWDRTVQVMEDCIDLCADLGGRYLVHGSPLQRRLPEGGEDDRAAARKRALEAFARAARRAETAGVAYCLEALTPPRSNFVTSIAEAAAVVAEVASPAFRTMIDCSAAGRGESEPVAALVGKWLPPGIIAHIHLNDRSLAGPGQGDDRFAPVLAALREHGYAGWLGVEPFEYRPDGPACAARAIGYLRGIEEALARPRN